jgi:hypothetical protein
MSRLASCLLLALAAWSCSGKPADRPATAAQSATPASGASAAGTGARFEEISARSGISFVHVTGATGEKYLPETLASGVCVLDYDGDTLADLYFVSGTALGKAATSPGAANRLYRNRGDGSFEDVTPAAGVAGRGYGIGCAAGDFDSDGREDLYVANFGPNVLYRNRGDGTFEDVTAASGTGDPSFSTGATLVDVDGDGDLDLYVVNYMDYSLENNKYCGEMKPGYRSYCGPEIYPGAPDRLYRNDGGGRFTDISSQAGIANPDGRGLGVMALDYDQDGDMDLYVANDGMANYLYRNEGGRFTEVGMLAGAALADDGRAQAGMGVDAGDYDGDGWEDFFVANLSFQPSSLYHNQGDGSFAERSFKAGLAAPTYLMTGYGTGFFDFDNDGWLDLFQANGHMMDNVALYFDNLTFPEPAQLFRNRGNGTFEDVTAARAPDLQRPSVGRGSAFLDLENDGDLDLVMLVAGGAPRLFRNTGGEATHFLRVTLRGTRSNRDGFGARLRLLSGGREQVRTAKASSGYASQSEAILHFGLGNSARVESLEVRWPSGKVDRIGALEANRLVRIEEGSGRAEEVKPGR